MKANLVCKGGGIKGIALVGSIQYFEEHGYEWVNMAGTSAGAIVASLLAVGYSSDEIKTLLYEVDYKLFKDKHKCQYIPLIGDTLSFLMYKGIYAGNVIEEFLESKFKEKNKTTFKDVSIDGISKLKIITTDVSRKELVILPDDLVKYNIDPMEFKISKAVRMSLSLPFFYTPVKFKYQNNLSYIVDGGLLSNFPIWIFDDKDYKIPTIGLNLLDSKNAHTSNSQNIITYLLDVIETSLYTNEDIYFKGEDFARIVNIPTLGIPTTYFSISKEEKEALFNSGYNAAHNFLINKYSAFKK